MNKKNQNNKIEGLNATEVNGIFALGEQYLEIIGGGISEDNMPAPGVIR